MSSPTKAPDPVATLSQILKGPEKHFSPLYSLVIFFSVTMLVAIGAAAQTTGVLQALLVGFALLLPLILAVGFLVILWGRPHHLYSPSEYGHPTSVTELAAAVSNRRSLDNSGTTPPSPKSIETQVVAVEGARSSEGDKPELPQLPPIAPENESWETAFRNEIASEHMDLERAEEAFHRVQLEEKDEGRRTLNELAYLYARLQNGDSAALERIETLAERSRGNPELAPEAFDYLGLAFAATGAHQRAADAFRTALAEASSDEARMRAVVQLAYSLSRQGQRLDAEKVIREGIAAFSERRHVGILYRVLALQFKEEKEHELAALAYECALEFDPGNTSLRFDAAFACSQADLEALALRNYLVLLQTSPKHKTALNNAGVAFYFHDMKTKAVESYRKAFELGETLSAANLARLYLERGFVVDARNLLEEAAKADDPHPDVGSVMASIAEQVEEDTETEDRILKGARVFRTFLLKYFSALLTPEPAVTQFAGEWLAEEGYTIVISSDGGRISGTWDANGKRHTFDGTATNWSARSSKISTTNPSATYWTWLPDLASDTFIYLTDGGSALEMVAIKDQKTVDLLSIRATKVH